VSRHSQYTLTKMHTVPFKLHISPRKRATNYRALLRKETYTDKAFYASSPPCTSPPHTMCQTSRP